MKFVSNFLRKAGLIASLCASATTVLAAPAAPTVSYGQQALGATKPWRSSVFETKLKSDTSILYTFEGDQNVTGTEPTYSVSKTIGSTTINKLTKTGSNTVMYIQGGVVKIFRPSEVYRAPNWDNLNRLVFNSSEIKEFDVNTKFTGIDTATVVHANSRTILWVSGNKLYSAGGSLNAGTFPGAVVLNSDVLEYKSFGEMLFIKTSSGVFYVSGNGQNVLTKVFNASELAFLDDPLQVYELDRTTFAKIESDGTGKKYDINGFSANYVKLFGNSSEGNLVTGNSDGTLNITSYSYGFAFETINGCGNTSDIDKVLGLIDGSLFLSGSTSEVGAMLVYLDKTGHLTIKPMNKSGACIPAANYKSTDIYDRDTVGIVMMPMYVAGSNTNVNGITRLSLGSSSPKAVGASAAAGEALKSNGMLLFGGANPQIIAYDEDTNTWIVTTAPSIATDSKFVATPGQTGYDWYSLESNNSYYLNTVRGNISGIGGTLDLIVTSTKVLDKNLYDGKDNYLGRISSKGLVYDKRTSTYVDASIAFGTFGSASNAPYTAIDTPTYSQLAATTESPSTLFGGISNAKVYAPLGDAKNATVAMLDDGSLRWVGPFGSAAGTVTFGGSNSKSIAPVGVLSPIEIPLGAGLPTSGVKASKGQFNDKVTISWNPVSAGTKYTVKREFGGVSEIVATDITESTVDDLSINGGSSPLSQMNYQVTSSPLHQVYGSLNYTNWGAVTPVFLQAGSGTYGGCSSSDIASKDCAGWRASAPSQLRLTPIIVDANSVANQIGTPTVTDLDNPYDTFSYSSALSSSHGGMSRDANDKIVYKPGANYVGGDSFAVYVKDKAGNQIAGTQSVNVICPVPIISGINIPSTYPMLTTQLHVVNYASNTCVGTMSMKTTIIDVDTGNEITSLASTRSAIVTGTSDSKTFSISDLMPGNYRMDIEVTSEKPAMVASHKVTRSAAFKVGGFGSYTLAMDKPIYTEDDLIIAKVNGSSDACVIGTESTAKATGKCYVVWNNNPLLNSLIPDASSIAGSSLVGSDFGIQATIFKYDSKYVARELAVVNQTFTVLPGIPTQLKAITFAKPFVRWMDTVKFNFDRDVGYDCHIKTTPAEAMVSVQANNKTCLLEADLPKGLAFYNNLSTNGAIVQGRIDQWDTDTPNTNIHYKLSKFFLNRAPSLMIEGDVSIPVVNYSMQNGLTQNKTSFATNSTAAILDAKILSSVPVTARACAMTSNSTTADTSYNTSSLSCFVEWDVIPPGLQVDVGLTPRLTGTPTVVGSNAVGYSVYAIRRDTSNAIVRDKVGAYSGTIDVVEVLAPSIAVTTPAKGTIWLEGETSARYLVDETGAVGSMTITAGDFSTVRMTILETGYAPQLFTGLKNGDKKALSLSPGSKGAWVNRDVLIKLEYEELGVQTPVNVEIKAIQLPASGVTTILPMPSTAPNDTDDFSLTAKVGSLNISRQIQYNAVRDGNWGVQLYTKQGLNLVPVTQPAFPDADGNVVFAGLKYNDYVGQQIFSVAKAVLPTNSVYGGIKPLSVTSASGITLNFVMGSAIQGPTKLSVLNGQVPVRQTMDVTLSPIAYSALKSVNWYVSDDNQATWKPLGVSGRSAVYTFTSGGIYFIRGQMTNKYTNIVSYSEPVSFTAKESLSAVFVTNDLIAPSTPQVVNLIVKSKTGDVMTDYNSRWEITNSSGDTLSYTDVTSVTLQSDTPTTYSLDVMVKSKTSPEQDPLSWTVIKKSIVVFQGAKPKVLIAGPRLVEANATGHFTASILKPWARNVVTEMDVQGKWILPDGNESTAASVDFTPIVANGLVQKIKYVSWVTGMQSTTESTTEYSVSISAYIFPNFLIKASVDSAYAPAYLRLLAMPATPFDGAQMRGKKFTFTWTMPTDFPGIVSGTTIRGIADTPKSYDFSLVIADDRGNSQTLPYNLTLDSMKPYVFSFTLTPALKFNRNPMTYGIKTLISGGHPKDRISKVDIEIDGANVATYKGMPRSVIVPTSGDHEVKLKATTLMGINFEAAQMVTVNENSLPVCNIKQTWSTPGKVVKLETACTDIDGRAVRFSWKVNGVATTRTNNYMYVVLSADVPNAEVECTIIDDAGGSTTASASLTYSP
jgi:hypothetical protein